LRNSASFTSGCVPGNLSSNWPRDLLLSLALFGVHPNDEIVSSRAGNAMSCFIASATIVNSVLMILVDFLLWDAHPYLETKSSLKQLTWKSLRLNLHGSRWTYTALSISETLDWPATRRVRILLVRIKISAPRVVRKSSLSGPCPVGNPRGGHFGCPTRFGARTRTSTVKASAFRQSFRE
jgi:hypothetical protein